MVERSVEVILVGGSVGKAMVELLQFLAGEAFHNRVQGLWVNKRPLVVDNANPVSGCACIVVLGADEVEQILMRTRASLCCC